MLNEVIFKYFVSHQTVQKRLHRTEVLKREVCLGHLLVNVSAIDGVVQFSHRQLYVTEPSLSWKVACAKKGRLMPAFNWARCHPSQRCQSCCQLGVAPKQRLRRLRQL